jgi:hypothetical protein
MLIASDTDGAHIAEVFKVAGGLNQEPRVQ